MRIILRKALILPLFRPSPENEELRAKISMSEFKNQALTILAGDCREILKTLPSESVQCCITSPPYWGLRDYGHHDQIGQETTPEEYVEALRAVFKEVWRVLRKDGTLWLNLGDSYASTWPSRRRNLIGNDSLPVGDRSCQNPRLGMGLKNKDLVAIPWMVALALRADGWYLRSDIIWHKPNPMPENVKDRPTKTHEYVFLLSKSLRYAYDSEAIREIGRYPAGTRAAKGSKQRKAVHGVNARPPEYKYYNGFRNKRTVWTVPTSSFKGGHFATFPPSLIKPCILAGCPLGGLVLDPFAGSGTTGMVALELRRRAVLIEANPDYVKMIQERCAPSLADGFAV